MTRVEDKPAVRSFNVYLGDKKPLRIDADQIFVKDGALVLLLERKFQAAFGPATAWWVEEI